MNEVRQVDTTIEEPPLSGGSDVAIAERERPPAIAEGPGALLSAIVQLAKDPAVDVTKLDALLKMQERMEARQAEIEFDRALARIAAVMPRVKKNGTVELGSGKGSFPFAKWEDIDSVIRPLMAAEGFTLSFTSEPRADGGGLVVTGMLLHRDGHFKVAAMPLPLDTGPGRSNIQATGSTLSYGKRYCAEMLLNIVREGDDDDGHRGGMQFATPAQAAEIEGLIESTKSDKLRFLQFFGVSDVANLQAAQYVPAKNMLLAKAKPRSGRDAPIENDPKLGG